jgi:exodeoxyribonuclease-5
MNVEFSLDQIRALEQLLHWTKDPKNQSITLGGYAGTGKTTLIGALRKQLAETKPDLAVAFAAFTGKASQVLRQTLEQQKAFYPQDYSGTIHSLLYKPSVDKEGKIVQWKKTKDITADLIIIDEASMVTDTIWFDLLSYRIPIIAVGDHGQLPPIGGNFNLMQRPELRLEQIHRQAENNPIIQLAHQAREQGIITPGDNSPSVRKFSYQTHDASDIQELIEHLCTNFHQDMLVLCGRNNTRIKLNNNIRQQLGRETQEPEGGERVVCLKNNYERAFEPIYNGMVGIIESIYAEGDHWYQAKINFPDDQRSFEGHISKYQFNASELIEKVDGLHFKEIGNRFDFGYALTVHKAQGSQAKTVLLFEERFQKSDDEQWKRWLYTAVTRARECLYIISP